MYPHNIVGKRREYEPNKHVPTYLIYLDPAVGLPPSISFQNVSVSRLTPAPNRLLLLRRWEHRPVF